MKSGGYLPAFIAAVSLALAAMVVAAPFVLAWQILQWLRFGVWHPLTVADGLAAAGWSTPLFAWVGVQRLSDWATAQPLTVSLFFGGLAVLVTFLNIMSHIEDDIAK